MTKRVSLEQRQKLFEFMQGREDLARGRISGPDAAHTKRLLLVQLAEELNAMGSGATKTPEKWLKSWQDWKSDVKAKALRLKKYRAGTGGGPSPCPLSPLEENLLQFYGVEMVEGLPGVADPLEVTEDIPPVPEVVAEVLDSEEPTIPSPQPTRGKRGCASDPLHAILERQAAAIEHMAAGMHNIAAALQQIAAALQPEVLLPHN